MKAIAIASYLDTFPQLPSFIWFCFFLFFCSCNKTDERIEIPVLTTKNLYNITATTAEGGGFVINDGGSSVIERGLCYSLTINPTINEMVVVSGSGNGNFQNTLTGLNPNSTYYVRAYGLNKAGIGYGNQVSFVTLSNGDVPSVNTMPITSITQNSAISGGNVLSAGASPVKARGVCWSQSPSPDISDAHTTDGIDIGSFESHIDGLLSLTVYYLRAYATNNSGTGYGNQISFSTAGASGETPVVVTTAISSITTSSAISGGNVISSGSTSVTQRGVCWSTLPNPTIGENHTSDGTGIGFFSSSLTELTANTLYYVRAYALNNNGISYGDTISFKTLDPGPINCPSVVTYEGRIYNTIEIHSQCWLKENLNVGIRIDGTQTQVGGNGIKEKYCYDDQESNCDLYGGLYQWDEVMQGVTSPGDKGICPDGWHVPDEADWNELANFLGGDSIAGGKLKKSGTAYWKSPNTGATNSSGFSALPGGYRGSNQQFSNLTLSGLIWTSSEGDATIAWYRSFYYSSEQLGRYSGQKIVGYSVRCLKNK